MKKSMLIKIVCTVLCLSMIAAFAGCGAKTPGEKSPEAAGVDLREKLAALTVSDKELDIAGKYTALSEIPGITDDPDIVGTWESADGETIFTFTEDGRAKATALGEENEAPYGCVKIGDYDILCEEIALSPEFYEGAKEGDTAVTYTAYEIDGDVMYSVTVEEVNEDFTSSMSAIVAMYRVDESGSAAKAKAGNPIALSTFAGTWESDKGSFTIEGDKLTLGDESYDISVNEDGALVVGKDGKSTAYGMSIISSKEYDYEDRSKSTQSVGLSLFYVGADENDKPNLVSILEDWKAEYDYEEYRYTGNFNLK